MRSLKSLLREMREQLQDLTESDYKLLKGTEHVKRAQDLIKSANPNKFKDVDQALHANTDAVLELQRKTKDPNVDPGVRRTAEDYIYAHMKHGIHPQREAEVRAVGLKPNMAGPLNINHKKLSAAQGKAAAVDSDKTSPSSPLEKAARGLEAAHTPKPQAADDVTAVGIPKKQKTPPQQEQTTMNLRKHIQALRESLQALIESVLEEAGLTPEQMAAREALQQKAAANRAKAKAPGALATSPVTQKKAFGTPAGVAAAKADVAAKAAANKAKAAGKAASPLSKMAPVQKKQPVAESKKAKKKAKK